MPSIIRTKRSSTPGAVPAVGALADGELAVNTADGKLYVKIGSGAGATVVCIGTVTSAAAAAILALADLDAIKAALGIVAPPVPYLASGFELFTASGTFNAPAGFTQAFAIVIGGGGGGAGWDNTAGSSPGGFGGVAAGIVAISGAMTVTVGGGGTGTNANADGTDGGGSSFATLTATGGVRGRNNGVAPSGQAGTGSGGVFLSDAGNALLNDLLTYPNRPDALPVRNQSVQRANAAGSTAPVPYTFGGTVKPGARGLGETSSSGNNATGGVGGAVFIFW